MEEYLKEALEIAKAQAGVRNMTEEEITSMVKKISHGIRNIGNGAGEMVEADGEPTLLDPKKAIREKSIIVSSAGSRSRF